MTHQAYGGLFHHAVKQHQVLVFKGFLLGTDEVVPQIVLELGPLLADVREIDEESRAHVSLEGFYIVRLRGFIHLNQEIAVFE